MKSTNNLVCFVSQAYCIMGSGCSFNDAVTLHYRITILNRMVTCTILWNCPVSSFIKKSMKYPKVRITRLHNKKYQYGDMAIFEAGHQQMQSSFASRSTCFPFVSLQIPFPARSVSYTFFLPQNNLDIYSLYFNRTEMQRQQQ